MRSDRGSFSYFWEDFLFCMPLHVKTEVVTPCKSAITEVTSERFASRVFPQMPRQLVRSRKSPVALGPRAAVRLLTRVRSLVRLQVGTLRVNLEDGKFRLDVNLWMYPKPPSSVIWIKGLTNLITAWLLASVGPPLRMAGGGDDGRVGGSSPHWARQVSG